MFNIFKKSFNTYTVEFYLSSGKMYKVDNAKDDDLDQIKRIMKDKGWLTFDLVDWKALNFGCVEQITITPNT